MDIDRPTLIKCLPSTKERYRVCVRILENWAAFVLLDAIDGRLTGWKFEQFEDSLLFQSLRVDIQQTIYQIIMDQELLKDFYY